MAWNEPGGNNNDPWGGKRNDQGPPDLDEVFKKLNEKISGFFGGGGSGGSNNDSVSGLMGFVVGVLAILYVLAGFYTIDQQERTVILRLGSFLEINTAGWHWNAPVIDRRYTENVTKVRTESHKALMLTKDENIVDVTISMQYVVSDVKAFVLNVRNPETSLAQAGESALRHVVGSATMDEVLTTGRQQVADDVMERLQRYLDSYGTGLLISQVNIEDAQPPKQVQAAFDDVIKAKEDEERLQNEAQGYANGMIPEARGNAARQVQEATAYKEQVVARATGEADRFTKLLTEYKRAPKVTRERLYIDAVEEVMQNSSKVLVNSESGNNLMYLPLDKMVQQGGAISRSNADLNDTDVRALTDQVLEDLRQRGVVRESR